MELPSYDLTTIQNTFSRVANLRMTGTARQGAIQLGFYIMTNLQCPICGEMTLNHEVRPMLYQYKDNKRNIDQPGSYCNACGESILGPMDLKATRKALAAFKATVDHLLTPDEIRLVRKQLKLNQQQAANICGGGKNAFSRYESGELLIPRAASNLLKVLAKEKSLLDTVTTEAA